MKSEIDRLRSELESKLRSCIFLFRIAYFAPTYWNPALNVFAAESDRTAADGRVQQSEARAADLEKFIDKERQLYGEKIRALEATVLQQKSEIHESRRSHDQQVRQCP